MELPNRTARVTGAAGGIGKAIVSALRDQDVTVASADMRSCDADHVNTADLMDPQFCDELPGRAADPMSWGRSCAPKHSRKRRVSKRREHPHDSLGV